ncbi:hypothetical protein [Polymorphospora rubra]|uniref:hypothetical protein n=1 Tax=Polymorphospora rubra TaxID=338584 RepID=UPI001BB37FA3|nr:hypothetical protein [Polymorphospora rubra]
MQTNDEMSGADWRPTGPQADRRDPQEASVGTVTFRDQRCWLDQRVLMSRGYNERCQPFRWTDTANQILAKAHRNTSG